MLDHIFATVGEVDVTAEFSGITGDSEMIAGSVTDPATVVTVSAVNGTDPPPSAGKRAKSNAVARCQSAATIGALLRPLVPRVTVLWIYCSAVSEPGRQ